MDYWTQNPEVLTLIGFEAKFFKKGLARAVIFANRGFQAL
jgi:hypothetical protein